MTNTSASLCSAVKPPPNNSLKLGKKTKLKAERRKRDAPFSGNGRVYSHSGACNGEFGGVAVSRNQVMIVRENLSVEATKNPTETSGFFGGEREHSPYSENGRVYSHSGACNGEFGGVAVSRNQVMIVRENLSVEATKNPTETSGFFGGEREIRTLEPFLTVTRFPVVRPRPTRRFLQKILNFTTLKLYLIYKALSNDIRRNSAKYA